MPITQMHEGLVRLFREHPTLAVDLLTASEQLQTESTARVVLDAENLTDLSPAERRADAVLLLKDEQNITLCALILEIQMAWDPSKLYRWPAYAMVLRDRRACDVEVVVVTFDPQLAERLAEPIRLGPRNVFSVRVIGPQTVPIVSDPAIARQSPWLAVLSAIAHPTLERALLAVDATEHLDLTEAALYLELLMGSVSSALRIAIEEHMANGEYEIQNEFLRKWRDRAWDQGLAAGRDKGLAEGRDKGLAEGLALGELDASRRNLLAFISSRALLLREDQRELILSETDLTRVERWIHAAGSAASVDAILRAETPR